MNKVSYLFILVILLGAYMYSSNTESIEKRKAAQASQNEIAKAE